MVDASAAVAALVNDGPARQALATNQLHAPHLIDSEVVNVLRREAGAGLITAGAAWTALSTWRRLGLARYPVIGLLDRIWQLRENLTAYDACYVALAEKLDCSLLTGDGRLTRAPRLGCPITFVPR